MEMDQPCVKTEDDNIPQTQIRWTPVETNLDDPKNCPDEDWISDDMSLRHKC